MLKEMDFYHSRENIKKQLMDTGLDAEKTDYKKVVRKAGEFIGHKIADAVTNSNDDNIGKEEPVGETIIPPEKRNEILNKLRKLL